MCLCGEYKDVQTENLNQPNTNLSEGPQPGVVLDRSRVRPLLVAGAAAFFTLGLTIVWPGSLLEKLHLITGGVCAQRPAHSYYMDGQMLPVEARMVGIFSGFALTWFFLWFIGRGRAGRLPRIPLLITLGSMVAVMALDGLNATFYDLGWPILYQPQNWLRLLTGTLSGIGLAGLIQPIFNYTAWKLPWRMASFRNWGELGAILSVGGLLMLAVFSDWGILFWPIALLTVGGGLWMLTVLNLLIYLVFARREGQACDSYDLLTTASIVFLVSLGEFAATAALRFSLIGPGIHL